MGPRKKTKPNPKADIVIAPLAKEPPPAAIPLPGDEGALEESTSLTEDLSSQAKASTNGVAPGRVSPKDAKTDPQGSKSDRITGGAESQTPRSTKSWYAGTWPRIPKAAPVTQIAKESISVAGGAAAELASSARSRTQQELSVPLKNPSLYLSRTLGSSSRSLPLSATNTKSSISSSNPSRSPKSNDTPEQSHEISSIKPTGEATRKLKAEPNSSCAISSQNQMPEAKDFDSTTKALQVESTLQEITKGNPSKWFSWFSANEITQSELSSASGLPKQSVDDKSTHDSLSQVVSQDVVKAGERIQDQRRNSDPNPLATGVEGEQQRRSWLGLWGNGSAQVKADTAQGDLKDCNPNAASAVNMLGGSKIAPSTMSNGTSGDSLPPQSSGWAFWSRNDTTVSASEDTSKPNVGELAVAGSLSQSKPENVIVGGAKGLPTSTALQGRTDNSKSSYSPDLKVAGIVSSNSNGKAVSAVPIPPNAKPPEATISQSPKGTGNLLLPSFKRTYRPTERPGFFEQLGRLFNYAANPQPKHVDILVDPPRIKKALAIGVHGYFPIPLIRSVLGQPTGTSIKFADSAANAIQKWTQTHGYSCEIEKIALEGEGKIEERVDLLWKLMLNWLEDIRKADFILVACHSQGVPVAMMLIAKLIAFGCVNGAVGSKTRIAVAAMAGVNLGPFAHYKSRWISGSAGELFDFARSESKVSKDYEAALTTALNFGVRIVYIGSIDDQLVSLEVSVKSGCVYIRPDSSKLY